MSNDLPFMPIWVSDLLSDRNVQLMDMKERGIYFTLLFNQWIDGRLTIDEARRLTHVEELPEIVKNCFEVSDEKIYNKRCEETHKDGVKKYKQKIRNAKKAGKASAAKRLDKSTRVQRPFNKRSTSGSTDVQPTRTITRTTIRTSKEENINKENDHLTNSMKPDYKKIIDHWKACRKKSGQGATMNSNTKESVSDLINLIDSEEATLENVFAAIEHGCAQTDWSLKAIVDNFDRAVDGKLDFKKPQKVSLANKNQTIDDDKYDH